LEFANATTDRFRIAVKKVREIKQTAASELENLGSGVEATVSFAQRVKEVAHRLFGRLRICCFHDGVLPNPGVSASCRLPKLPEKRRAKKVKRGS
jgi:hypothetical protein